MIRETVAAKARDLAARYQIRPSLAGEEVSPIAPSPSPNPGDDDGSKLCGADDQQQRIEVPLQRPVAGGNARASGKGSRPPQPPSRAQLEHDATEAERRRQLDALEAQYPEIAIARANGHTVPGAREHLDELVADGAESR